MRLGTLLTMSASEKCKSFDFYAGLHQKQLEEENNIYLIPDKKLNISRLTQQLIIFARPNINNDSKIDINNSNRNSYISDVNNTEIKNYNSYINDTDNIENTNNDSYIDNDYDNWSTNNDSDNDTGGGDINDDRKEDAIDKLHWFYNDLENLLEQNNHALNSGVQKQVGLMVAFINEEERKYGFKLLLLLDVKLV
ncbi:hypothetical protein C2G38_2056970 [Gigaspora rosea]|uniref:Uncharacterized protein n=1 Tax=Gigaspora rosea TaxID=44941 RepID=A0A397W5H6_9GLOM|nr:hypothetical protein C2G38_2056970 [Gigaspora rosea]